MSLPAVVEEASAEERREMEDVAVWALNRILRGIFPLAAYEEVGVPTPRIEPDIVSLGISLAAQNPLGLSI